VLVESDGIHIVAVFFLDAFSKPFQRARNYKMSDTDITQNRSFVNINLTLRHKMVISGMKQHYL